MKTLIGTSIKKPVTICVLVIILLAVGVLATMNMSSSLLPNMAMPMMGVTAIYPGASASSVEKDVTSVLENALKTVSGIKSLQTVSYDNVSVCIITFDYGTDLDKKSESVKQSFTSLKLPDNCQAPSVVKVDMNGSAAATVALYNSDGDLDKLASDAETLQKLFGGIEGVGSVNIVGSPERQIKITALEGLDIASLLLVQALSAENLDLPLGTVMADGSIVAIRNASDATSLLEVMRIPAKLQLPSSLFSQLSAAKSGVMLYSTCSLDEFEDYVDKALSARKLITDIEDMTADELERQSENLAAVKSLMALVRNNTAQSLTLMWGTINRIVTDEAFLSMNDEDLEVLADQYGIGVDVLKWAQYGAKDGTLKSDWNKLVEFRRIYPLTDTDGDGKLSGADITSGDFAYLFQNGATVTKTETDAVTGQVNEKQYIFEGLDLLHAHNLQCNYPISACDKKSYTHGEAVDVCDFAQQVNTVAYSSIIDTVREAENKGERPVITDAQFAALFVNTEESAEAAFLMSPSVIKVIRRADFETSVVPALREAKLSHVDENGEAVYKNNELYKEDADKRPVNSAGYRIDAYGYLADDKGNYIGEDGKKLSLSDAQLQERIYKAGPYVIFTDEELLALYGKLDIDLGMGIEPTMDVLRFIRITDFSAASEANGESTLIVPVSSLGYASEYINHSAYAQFNDFLSVTIEIYTVADADITRVIENVKKIMSGVSLSSSVILLDDKAELINDSISNVLSSIIIGGVLAILVIYVFVRKIGSSLVISITMPLSVLVALLCLWAMKISLNMVSLGGLAVGIGMLVDNSIVVLESITKHRDRGNSVFDSCLNGTREVAGSLIASTLTNVCVFFPILFTKGLTKEIFNDLVWAVIFSIVMSLIVSVTVIPSLYHLIYKKPHKERVKTLADGTSSVRASFESKEPRTKLKSSSVKHKKPIARTVAKSGGTYVSRSENAYGNLLRRVLSKRLIVCIVALALFSGSVLLVFSTGMDFMPSVDKGLIEVNLTFDSSADLDQAKAKSLEAADKVRAANKDTIEYIAVTVGKQGLLAANVTGKLRIQLNGRADDTGKAAQKIRSALKDLDVKSVAVTEMDGVVAEVTSGMSGTSVTLLGPDLDVLSEISKKVASKLQNTANIVSVTDNASQKTEQVSFRFDRQLCADNGVDYSSAVMLLRVGLSGYTAANVKINSESTEVNVSFAEGSKSGVETLINIAVGFNEDGAVKIKDVLKRDGDGNVENVGLIRDSVVSVINKKDGVYTTTVDVEIYGTDQGTVAKRINAAVESVLENYKGYSYEEGGVASYLSEAFDGLAVSLIAAFLLLYGVMACQFESLVKPFIVIMSIPFSFTGGFLALAITGTSLSVVSFVGIIMLMGVIVNGAIVMIDKIDMLIAEGKEPSEAVVEGCKTRLRPILMTTLTTILALVPLALGLGKGGELMQPMGIVVLGGLLLGTAVTLILIPCFYCLVKGIRYKKLTPQTVNAVMGKETAKALDNQEANAISLESETESTSTAALPLEAKHEDSAERGADFDCSTVKQEEQSVKQGKKKRKKSEK